MFPDEAPGYRVACMITAVCIAVKLHHYLYHPTVSWEPIRTSPPCWGEAIITTALRMVRSPALPPGSCDAPWPVADLRVDWSDDPIEDLARLRDLWGPQLDAYVTRALNPSGAPSYGVPGDR